MLKCALPVLTLCLAAHAASPGNYAIEEGYVDANGVMLYYKSIAFKAGASTSGGLKAGRSAPLVILHGGPGASHDYFLPYLLPLARTTRLIFLDERGSGRSGKLQDASGYTVENMVEDVEAARRSLGLGDIALLGHSYGGVLAQAYALKYQSHLSKLLLCSTFSSASDMNEVFRRQLAAMPAELRERIQKLETAGLFGKGKGYERSRYPADYMTAAWGEAYFPYLYQERPDPNYDPIANGNMAWDLYREMWGSHGEFVIDGNLKSVEYGALLDKISVPTLIAAGDHDECDPAMARDMHAKIAGSKLVIFPRSGHMTFVDQPELFTQTVRDFLAPPGPAPAAGRPGSRPHAVSRSELK